MRATWIKSVWIDHPVIQEMSLPVAEVERLKVPHDLYEIWEEGMLTIQARKSFTQIIQIIHIGTMLLMCVVMGWVVGDELQVFNPSNISFFLNLICSDSLITLLLFIFNLQRWIVWPPGFWRNDKLHLELKLCDLNSVAFLVCIKTNNWI